MTHTFLGETIEYDILYKRRKTMGIYIDVYGHVEVRVPRVRVAGALVIQSCS